MQMQHVLAASILSLLTAAPLAAQTSRVTTADLVVYGGTASGVMTAYAGAKQGLKVVLLEPTEHVGGMVTGGLSATDSAYFAIIGGYANSTARLPSTTARMISTTRAIGFPNRMWERRSSTTGCGRRRWMCAFMSVCVSARAL